MTDHNKSTTADTPHTTDDAQEFFLDRSQLNQLIRLLTDDGYQVVGPTIDQGAIAYGEISSVSDLPAGWTDIQEPGKYRLEQRNDQAYFGYVVGPHSWKKYLFPPRTIVAESDRKDSGWHFSTPEPQSARYAFLGVRACELAAIRIQDRIFLDGPCIDPVYQQRRATAFIIAVNCTQAAATCFCTSMNTGPRCTGGFDLALTETADGFLMEIGSASGRLVAERLSLHPATQRQQQNASAARQQATDQISRQLNSDGIHDLLMQNLRHAHWDEVASRCLSCTNCTMVCPTCFCSSVKDVSDLTGDHVSRERTWDSCFNIGFSSMNGSPVRDSISSRYRQWLTHKLATWHDQFGSSGCVGCGRCITWCPVGIDLTQEVAALRSAVELAASRHSAGDSENAEVSP